MGANDPIRTTTTPMSDALVAAITQAWELTLADRTAGGVLANPALAAGFLGGGRLGALGKKKVFVGYGADKLVTTAEGTDLTVYTVSSSAATVTPARKGLARQVSDMSRMFDEWGITEWAEFVRDSTWAWQQTVLDTIAALFASFSASGGGTGAAMTVAKLLAARNTLGIANVPPPYCYVCQPKTWAEVCTDGLSLGGAFANDAKTLELQASPNPGYKGRYLQDIDVYTSSEVDVSGADYISGIFGAQAIAWDAIMPANPSPNCTPILLSPLFAVETQRIVLKGEDYVATSSHIGASIGINAAGVKVLSVVA